MTPLLEVSGLRKTYRGGDGALLEVLNSIDITVRRGEIVAIVGASGSGKSSLLHILGALDEASAGDVILEGRKYSELDEQGKAHIRARSIGFVFQFHHLLREFSALENVTMPQLINGVDLTTASSRAEELLATVGLAGRMTHRPGELSGGEQQRCAVARALVNDPKIVLADEPTGNLDFANVKQVGNMFFDLARELETAVVLVTHNPEMVERADRVFSLENGRLVQVDAREVTRNEM